MEVFFVYGLVIIFFIALPLLIFFLMKEPVRDTEADTSSDKASARTQKERAAQSLTTIASYGLLAAIFALLFFVSIISQRHHV